LILHLRGRRLCFWHKMGFATAGDAVAERPISPMGPDDESK
jgi:hypothetical protein